MNNDFIELLYGRELHEALFSVEHKRRTHEGMSQVWNKKGE